MRFYQPQGNIAFGLVCNGCRGFVAFPGRPRLFLDTTHANFSAHRRPGRLGSRTASFSQKREFPGPQPPRPPRSRSFTSASALILTFSAASTTFKFAASNEAPPAGNTGTFDCDLDAVLPRGQKSLLQSAPGEPPEPPFFSAPCKAGCIIYMPNELKIGS
jgi:hypothetical protein